MLMGCFVFCCVCFVVVVLGLVFLGWVGGLFLGGRGLIWGGFVLLMVLIVCLGFVCWVLFGLSVCGLCVSVFFWWV